MSNKSFFRYVRCRKSARAAVGLLKGEGGEGELKEDLEIAEKLRVQA